MDDLQRCRLLCMKEPVDDPLVWGPYGHPAASYWCLKTLDVVGPDDRPAHAAACRGARACFESADVE